MNDIIRIIKENETFLITCHKSPDGDAIGSSIALGLALKKINKKVTYVVETPIQEKFSYMHESEFFIDSAEGLTFDVGLFLDCSDASHLYDSTTLDLCSININIDHHISNTCYGDINFLDTGASAAGEIIYDIIKNLEVSLDSEIALALYTSIVTDTGNFKYSNVTSKTHNIIADLYSYPNTYWDINKKIFDEHSFLQMKLLGKALNNLFLAEEGKIAIIYLTAKDYSEAVKDDEGIINYARDIEGVDIAMMLKEVDHNTFKISFRSNSDYDVSKLASYYGGGGHQKASGCTIKGAGRENVIKNILKKINL